MCALWFAINFDPKSRKRPCTERMVKYKAHDEVQLLEEQTLHTSRTFWLLYNHVQRILLQGIPNLKCWDKNPRARSERCFQPVNWSWFCHRVQKQKHGQVAFFEISNRPGDVRIGSALLAANHSTKMCKYSAVKHFLHRPHFANKKETRHSFISPRLGLQLWGRRTPSLQPTKPLLNIAVCHKDVAGCVSTPSWHF